MADLTALHSQAKRLIISLREGLERLETDEGRRLQYQNSSGEPNGLAADLRGKLAELQRTSAQMDGMWRMQVIRENNSKRDVWKRKVEQVSEEADTIRMSLDKYSHRENRRQVEKQEREELMQRADVGRKIKSEMDEEAQVMGAVARSKRALEEIYESGSNILVSMAGNRERLKAAHRRALDVLNTVGLGDSLLKFIERRQRMDIYMAYGGMVVMLLVVGLVVWFAWF